MSTTTTTTDTAEMITVDYGPMHRIVDRIITAESTESVAWVELFDYCSSADDPAGAWVSARDHYVATFPRGKSGRTTRPADTFKSRKSDVTKVRTAHPKMSADAIVAAYGSVRSAAGAIRKQERDARAAEAPASAAPAEPTPAERLAEITAAVRLAVAAGVTADAIDAAVTAGLPA